MKLELKEGECNVLESLSLEKSAGCIEWVR